MAFTYDLATAIGKVRQNIPDTVDSGHLFEDAELQSFLDDNDDSVNYAAAAALDSLAGRYARSPKRIKSLDTDVEMPSPKELRDQASALREREDDSGTIEIAELVTNHFSAAERIRKQFQRGVI